jgi:hypothetical protein
VLKKLLRGLLKRPVYAYRRRRDLAMSKLPEHAKFLGRIGTNTTPILTFPSDWLNQPTSQQNKNALRSIDSSVIATAAKNSVAGVFDVLGSGPVLLDYEFKAAGAFGHTYHQPISPTMFKNRVVAMRKELESAREFLDDDSTETTRLLRLLDTHEFAMVDWHVDAKSGYRWDSAEWWLDQRIGTIEGADIKVPWEISRGQDLVTLAIASNIESPSRYSETLSLRLLDWIIANPARTGVNWRSTMEVAIRAANWIWALAISEQNTPASPSIIWIVARSLEQHADFIVQYPDESGPGANNHYIADMAGLAHIAAAIPAHKHASMWGQIAATGLAEQAELATNDDGFSYEGSVGYHRFVTELLTHGSLATLKFPESWPASRHINKPRHWKAVLDMFDAADYLQKPNGNSPQFGDHDAGRFLKFHGEPAPDGNENPLNHSHLQHLARGIGDASTPIDRHITPESIYPTLGINPENLKLATQTFASSDSHINNKERRPGAWVGRSGPIWCAIRCFNPDPTAPTGHLHDDSLTIELCVADQDIFVDPGTGVYTAEPQIRNQLRSRKQHSTAAPSNYAEIDSHDMFELNESGITAVSHSDQTQFRANYLTGDWALDRNVEISESGFKLTDSFEIDIPWCQVFIFHPGINISIEDTTAINGVNISWAGGEAIMRISNPESVASIDDALYSPNYGTIVPTKRLTIEHHSTNVSTINFEIR